MDGRGEFVAPDRNQIVQVCEEIFSKTFFDYLSAIILTPVNHVGYVAFFNKCKSIIMKLE